MNLLKKFSVCTLLLGLLTLSTPIFSNTVPLVSVNNKIVTFDTSTSPYITQHGYTVLPFRALSEVIDLSVDWQSPYVIAKGTHQQTGNALDVRLKVGSSTIYINNIPSVITTPIEMKNDRTYIPLRLLSETFGYNVNWVNGTVYITTPNQNSSGSNNSGSQLPTTPNTPSAPSTPSVSNFESEVAQLVNNERAAEGLSPLTLHTNLSNVAREKSKDMRVNQYFSHTSPVYGSPFDMLKQFGISYSMAAENIAQGYTTPSAVVKGWMNSPGHRQNIMNPNLTHIGVGYDSAGHYWTQLFITP